MMDPSYGDRMHSRGEGPGERTVAPDAKGRGVRKQRLWAEYPLR